MRFINYIIAETGSKRVELERVRKNQSIKLK